MIQYEENGLNIRRIFGIQPEDFLQMHEDLVELGLVVRSSNVKLQIDFVLYCHALAKAGENVETLIREFNTAQKGDGTDMWHALSLAKIYYHYNAVGYNVLVRKTHKSISQPDLTINNLNCEIKTRIDQTIRRLKQRLPSGIVQDEDYEILSSEIRSREEDLRSAILNSVKHGFNQADCVILDLSDHFHSWNYYRLLAEQNAGTIEGLSSQPVRPYTNTCILFSPNNALDLNQVGFNPRAYWGYLLLNAEAIIDNFA